MATWYFYYPKRFAFYPLDYEGMGRGLGGTEGTLVLITEALAQIGHNVQVFNCCYKPGIYNNVIWRMAWEIDEAPPPDVLVSVRTEDSIRPDLVAGKRFYWMLDERFRGPLQYHNTFPHEKIVVLSEAQRAILAQHGIDPHDKIEKIYCPVRLPQSLIRRQRKLSCLYCSAPHRGLDILLSMWPKIQEAVPEVKLWVTGGYQLWGLTMEEAEDQIRPLIERTQQLEGVSYFGVIPKILLRELQASCALMVYPCRFPEMFCISAAECSAVGTPIVTTAIGALPERVIHNLTGYLISHNIDNPNVQQQFIEKTIDLLMDQAKREQMSSDSLCISDAYMIDTICLQWERLLQ